MDDENKNFDHTVPENEMQELETPAKTSEQKPGQTAPGDRNEKANNLKALAENASIVSYGFIGDLKTNGHNSL